MLETRYTCPVIVGREREVAALSRLWQPVQSGHGQTVLVAGEAGVGKSRLLAELEAGARHQGWNVLTGHCYPPDVNLPYGPFLDAFRTYFRLLTPDKIAVLLGVHAAEMVKLLPELATLLPGVQPSGAVESEAEKRRLFEALYSCLAQMSAERPLLLALEDLHWSDDTSIDLLHLLARRIAHDAILLVLTYRIDEPVARPGTPWSRRIADLERQRLAAETRLTPLSPGDVGSMVQRIFDLDSISPEFASAIYSRTEGNPLFVEELLKALVESGDVFYSDGSWNRKALDDLNLPRSVREAILRHLDGVDSTTQHVASTAAAIGRYFDFGLLKAVSGLPQDVVLKSLHSLINQQLISLDNEGENRVSGGYQFRHALTHDALYERLLPEERQALHLRIAQTLEQLYSDEIEPRLAELAHHYWEARSWAKAMEYSEGAGRKAQSLYAPGAAIEHFTRALQAADHLSASPGARLYRMKARAHGTLGDFDSALAGHETALLMARASGEPTEEWQSLIDIGLLWAGRDYARAGTYFSKALELARESGDARMLARSLNRMGNWLVNTGRTADGLLAHNEALQIFRAEGDKQGSAETLDLLGMASGIHGDVVSSVRYYGDAIAAFRELGDTEDLISSITSKVAYSSPALLDTCESTLRTWEECEPDWQEALRLSRQIGWLAGQAYVEFAICSACTGFGRYGAAYEHGLESIRIATEISHSQWMAGAHYTFGHTCVTALDADRAAEHLQKALDLARLVGSAWWVQLSGGMLARAYLLRNDLDMAGEVLRQQMPPGHPMQSLAERRILHALGDLELVRGKPSAALEIADYLLTTGPAAGSGRLIPAIEKLRGEALLAMRRPEEAQTALEAALRGALERGDKSLLWRVHGALAALYSDLKDREQSTHHLLTARETIQELGDTFADGREKERF
ncbi:MAG TPA: AAA family ATPase, partial [Chloroflexia bacterium]|nr:AAA family ATPase [Chloroflexia bacterium]